jgi:hypothetical protein
LTALEILTVDPDVKAEFRKLLRDRLDLLAVFMGITDEHFGFHFCSRL